MPQTRTASESRCFGESYIQFLDEQIHFAGSRASLSGRRYFAAGARVCIRVAASFLLCVRSHSRR